MWRRQIWRMKIADLIWVIAAAGLNQHCYVPKQKAMNCKPLLFEIYGLVR
jgi:hypothetical protein